MTVASITAPRKFEDRLIDSVDGGLGILSDTALVYGGVPGIKASNSIEALRRRTNTFAVWIVLIVAVAVAVVLTVGIIAYVAMHCIRRGGSYDGGLSVKTNGWKVWEYRLRFRCTQ